MFDRGGGVCVGVFSPVEIGVRRECFFAPGRDSFGISVRPFLGV